MKATLALALILALVTHPLKSDPSKELGDLLIEMVNEQARPAISELNNLGVIVHNVIMRDVCAAEPAYCGNPPPPLPEPIPDPPDDDRHANIMLEDIPVICIGIDGPVILDEADCSAMEYILAQDRSTALKLLLANDPLPPVPPPPCPFCPQPPPPPPPPCPFCPPPPCPVCPPPPPPCPFCSEFHERGAKRDIFKPIQPRELGTGLFDSVLALGMMDADTKEGKWESADCEGGMPFFGMQMVSEGRERAAGRESLLEKPVVERVRSMEGPADSYGLTQSISVHPFEGKGSIATFTSLNGGADVFDAQSLDVAIGW